MHAAAQFLESIGKEVLGLMGHSKAGSGVLLYAANYGKIPRIANVSGRFDHKKGKPFCIFFETIWISLSVQANYKEHCASTTS